MKLKIKKKVKIKKKEKNAATLLFISTVKRLQCTQVF